jgi:hypothetical protein
VADPLAADPHPPGRSRRANLAAVAAALGSTIDRAFHCWHPWAAGQRESFIGGMPGVTAEDYNAVTRAFAAAGVTAPSEEPRRD